MFGNCIAWDVSNCRQEAVFEVTIDSARKRVKTAFFGVFDDDESEFEEAFRAAVRSVSPNGETFDLISDFSQADYIPEERAASAEQLIGWAVQRGLHKSANVIGEVYQKMQIKRLSSRNDAFQYFATVEDAESWLAH